MTTPTMTMMKALPLSLFLLLLLFFVILLFVFKDFFALLFASFFDDVADLFW